MICRQSVSFMLRARVGGGDGRLDAHRTSRTSDSNESRLKGDKALRITPFS
jgi:hypothetical protein